MQPHAFPQPPLPPSQAYFARNLARHARVGCFRQLRGCLLLLVVLAVVGTGGVWALSLVTGIPLVVFFSPLPYFTRYHFVVHPGQSEVYAVAWSPDGKRIASGSSEQDTVHVWDAATGRMLFSYQAPHGMLMPLAWSPDGTRLALADRAHPLVVLDAATGKAVFAVTGAGGHLSIAWSPDGKRIAAVSPTFAAEVWDASSGQTVATMRGASADEVAWSPNGKDLASASEGSVHVWDVASGQLLLSNTRRSVLDVAADLAWAPNSQLLAAQVFGPDQVREQVWDIASGHTVFSFAAPQSSQPRMVTAWSPDSKRLAIGGGSDRSVRVWNVATGRKLLTYGGHELVGSDEGGVKPHAGLQALMWSPDGRSIVSLGIEETIQIWDPATAAPRYVYDTNTSTDLLTFHGRYATQGARAVAWSPDEKHVAIGGNNFAEVWTP